jgi:hypothetical protein
MTPAQRIIYDTEQAAIIHIVPTKYKNDQPRTFLRWCTTMGDSFMWPEFTQTTENSTDASMGKPEPDVDPSKQVALPPTPSPSSNSKTSR